MIQAKEVMLNDWLLDKNVDFKYRYFQVKGIDPDDDGYICKNKFGYSYSDEFEPIPLTVEILKRNGFELRDGFLYHRIDDKPHHYDFKLKNGGVFTSEGYTLQCCIYHLTIRYVHELQHALRLCGLNELADNFKIEE